MDAREIIADAADHPDWNKLDAADYIICRLTAAGYQIIHRDENHGPTLERAAGVADKRANDRFASFDQTAKPYWDGAVESAERIASAIRAMGEKK